MTRKRWLLLLVVCGVASLAQGAEPTDWSARRALLEQRPRKIFAHYMGCFPVGATAIAPGYIRSKAPEVRHDSGRFENGFGGMKRGEPLLPDDIDRLTLEASADLEIRRALRAGIDGFAFMAIAGGPNNVFPVMDAMFKVAQEKDYPFEITWCLSNTDRSLVAIDYILKQHGDSPRLARRDGKVMMLGYQSAFNGMEGARRVFAERHPEVQVQWDDASVRATPEGLRLLREGFRDLERRFQTPMYFQFGFGALYYGMKGRPAQTLDWPTTIGILAEEFDAITAFHCDSGPDDYDAVAEAVTSVGSEWGEPIMFQYENLLWQGYRARSFPLVPGSDAIRERWERARANRSTLIQFTTWNDYHEATSLAPTTDTRYGLLDLNAHFVQWWKTGTPPTPARDRVYLLYPKYPHELTTYPFHNRSYWRNTEAMNRLDVVTILTAPAQVRLPGREETWDAPAGLSSRQMTLQPGPVAAEVVRAGAVVVRLDSPEPVTAHPYREQHSMVCVSSEDAQHWRADFGTVDAAPIQRGEYGDLDGDGLPNWFEMYWFGASVLDWASATRAEPDADPDGDGMTNLQEYEARTNPTVAAKYEPGFVWDFAEVGTSFTAYNPEYDRFGTPVWYFANKYAREHPVAHGGYQLCERFGWYPHTGNRAVYAPPYNTPDPSMPAGEMTRTWEGDPNKTTSSRFRISVGRFGLQTVGWRSPVAGRVVVKARLTPADSKAGSLPAATVSVEREGVAAPLLAKEFAPQEGVEITSNPIAVTPGQLLYLVLDAAPGGARGFNVEVSGLTVTLIDR